jgi:hypothetical protein
LRQHKVLLAVQALLSQLVLKLSAERAGVHGVKTVHHQRTI